MYNPLNPRTRPRTSPLDKLVMRNFNGEYLVSFTTKFGEYILVTSPDLCDARNFPKVQRRLIEKVTNFKQVRYGDCIHNTTAHYDDQR